MFTKWGESLAYRTAGWHHQMKQVTWSLDASVRLSVSEMLISGGGTTNSKQFCCVLFEWNTKTHFYFYRLSRAKSCTRVWDYVYNFFLHVSLRLQQSLVCMEMWLMTFINRSEQGLGLLQCCQLSPLLFSNDFLPSSFPRGWPCQCSGLHPSWLFTHSLNHTRVSLR